MSEYPFYNEEEVVGKDTDITLERVTTGISKLDELLQGGFPKKSIILVSGPPGSGKTILCYHFISEGIKKGERYVVLIKKD